MNTKKIATFLVLCGLMFHQKVNAQVGGDCAATNDCVGEGLVCFENVCTASFELPACYLVSSKTCDQAQVSIDFCSTPNQKFDTLLECEAYRQSQVSSEPATESGANSSAPANTGNNGETIGCREGQDCVSLINPLATTDNPNPKIPTIIGNGIQIVMGIIGSITLVVFLYGGFLWLTSAGNSEKIAQGMQAMLWAGIGIIVIFSSYAILTLILQTLQASP